MLLGLVFKVYGCISVQVLQNLVHMRSCIVLEQDKMAILSYRVACICSVVHFRFYFAIKVAALEDLGDFTPSLGW